MTEDERKKFEDRIDKKLNHLNYEIEKLKAIINTLQSKVEARNG